MRYILIALMLVAETAGAGDIIQFCDGQGNCFSVYDSPSQIMTLECDPIRCPGSIYIDNTPTVPVPGNYLCIVPCNEAQRKDLVEAAEGVLPYLDDPNYQPSGYSMIHPIYIQPPTEMERAEAEVKRLKDKATAIQRFRDALNRAKGE